MNEVIRTATDGRNGLFASLLRRLRFAAIRGDSRRFVAIRGDLLISDTRRLAWLALALASPLGRLGWLGGMPMPRPGGGGAGLGGLFRRARLGRGKLGTPRPSSKGPATRNDFVNDIVDDTRADAIFAPLKSIVDDIVTCGRA